MTTTQLTDAYLAQGYDLGSAIAAAVSTPVVPMQSTGVHESLTDNGTYRIEF